MGSKSNFEITDTEERVMQAAAVLGGWRAARTWYDIPIPDLAGLSPRQLVEIGQAHDVLEYLKLLEIDLPAEHPHSVSLLLEPRIS